MVYAIFNKRLGYQYQPYPPYYKMAPVYSWYQRDQEPAAEVKMEPDSKGENLGKRGWERKKVSAKEEKPWERGCELRSREIIK